MTKNRIPEEIFMLSSGPDENDPDLDEYPDYDDGYDDGDEDHDLVLAQTEVLDCMIKLCTTLKEDITESANIGTLMFGALVIKRHSDILLQLVEDQAMNVLGKGEDDGKE